MATNQTAQTNPYLIESFASNNELYIIIGVGAAIIFLLFFIPMYYWRRLQNICNGNYRDEDSGSSNPLYVIYHQNRYDHGVPTMNGAPVNATRIMLN